MNKIYNMDRKEYQELLKVTSEQVPFGIYAVKKNGYAELRCDKCDSKTQLKKLVREFRKNGFKVHKNEG